MTAWQVAAVAAAIGVLIGWAREPGGRSLVGLRTFGLAGLAGGLAALVHPLVLAALVAGAAVIMAAGHLRPEGLAPGATTEVALTLTVVLGGLVVNWPPLAAGAAVVTAGALFPRDQLHPSVREKITELGLGDALKFGVAAFIAFPFMPHAHLGPYGVIDPRTIWTYVVAVTVLGWLGYVMVRLVGPRRGLPAAGLAGGFVSAAATTGAMARTARTPDLRRPALAGALLASVATLVQLDLVVAVADTHVAGLLVPPIALACAVLVGEAGWLVLRDARAATEASMAEPTVELNVISINFADLAPEAAAEADPEPAAQPGPIVGRRPFALIPALMLGVLITLFTMLAALAEHALGGGGAVTAIVAAGLADAHAGALTAAGLSAQGTLATATAVLAVMAAVGAHTVIKLVLAYAAGGRDICTRLAALFAGPVVAVVIGLVITLGVR